eukprot:668625-Rhodomonas_salina.2
MRVVSYDTAVDTAVRHATIVSVLSYDSFSDPPSLPPPYPARDPLPLARTSWTSGAVPARLSAGGTRPTFQSMEWWLEGHVHWPFAQ